jgi:hypothetical protein
VIDFEPVAEDLRRVPFRDQSQPGDAGEASVRWPTSFHAIVESFRFTAGG